MPKHIKTTPHFPALCTTAHQIKCRSGANFIWSWSSAADWFRRMQCSRGVWVRGFASGFRLRPNFGKFCGQRRRPTECRAALLSNAPSKTQWIAKRPSTASRAVRNSLVQERGYVSRNWLVRTRDGLGWPPLPKLTPLSIQSVWHVRLQCFDTNPRGQKKMPQNCNLTRFAINVSNERQLF